MAIQVRKKENKVEEVEVKEAEVVEAGAPNVDVKLPPMTDKFLMTSGSAFSWMMEHRRMIILVIAIVVAVCLSFIAVMNSQENARVEKSSILSTVFVTLHAPTKAQAEERDAQAKAEFERKGIAAETNSYLQYRYTVPDDATRYKGLTKYLNDNMPALAETELAPTAELLLAGVATHNGDMETAATAFNKAKTGSQDLKLFALFGEAENLTQEKKYAEAIAKYDEIDQLAAGYGSYIKLTQGNIYEMMGDTENAIKAYTSVFRDYNIDSDHVIAQTRLRLLTPDWQALILPAAAPAAAAPAAAPEAAPAPTAAPEAAPAPAAAPEAAPAAADPAPTPAN